LRLEQLANVGSGLTGLDFLGKPIQVPKFKRLISGVADFRQGDRLNSVAAIQNGRLLGTSTKQHLVPFGEFFIFRRELAFIYNPIFGLLGLGESFGGLNLRYETRTLQLDFERFGTYVCYDSVFPDVSRARVLDGAQVLVNVSNDGWFGRTWGIEQHFLMGRMRAIETGRSVLRVGNTGITAVIDARGQVKQRAPIQQSLALEVRYGLESGQTPYVRFGDWAVGLALLLLGIAVGSSRTNAEAW
jgi:apolipoprotein N-acyltransferase